MTESPRSAPAPIPMDEELALRSDEELALRSDEELARRSDEELARRSDEELARRSDEELALRARSEARSGGTSAFEELVARLQRPLYGFLLVRVGNASEAEELVQEAFLRAWRKLELYDTRWRFSTWLFTLAKRLAVSRARTRRPDAQPTEGLVERLDHARLSDAARHDPAGLAAEREERDGVWRLAACILSEEQRSALWLRYAEGLSNQEIAAILGRPRVTVRVILFRAREALAKALRDAPGSRKSTLSRSTPLSPWMADSP